MLNILQRIRDDTDDDDNNIITLDVSCLMYDSGYYIIIYRMYRYNNPPSYASSGEKNCVQLARTSSRL